MQFAQPMQILIVDDDAEMACRHRILKRFGHRAEAVISGEEALARLSAAKPGYDIVFVDHVMYTGINGIQMLRRVKNEWPELPIVLFTGQGDVESGVEALRLGAYRYMFKPIVHEELQLIIQAVHEVEGLRREKEWLSILLQISRMTLLSANDMDRALQAIAETAERMVGFQQVVVSLVDRDHVDVHAMAGLSTEEANQLRYRAYSREGFFHPMQERFLISQSYLSRSGIRLARGVSSLLN